MYHVSIDPQMNLLIVSMDGLLVSNTQTCELIRKVHESIDRLDPERKLNRLFDVRQLEIVNFNSELVQMAAYLIQQFNKEWGPIKIADVVSSDVMYGEHRVLAVLSELPHIDRGVFRSVQAAREWLIGQSWDHVSESAKRGNDSDCDNC